jgi:hypothetical protein
MPSARRISRAYHHPPDDSAPAGHRWVYLLELDPGAFVDGPRSDLDPGVGAPTVIEVSSAADDLPHYHVEALRASCGVWSRHT